MNELIKSVDNLVSSELICANSKHEPKFNSLHEAYAVVLEEAEESQAEWALVKNWLDMAWERIKADDEKGANVFFLNAERRAIQTAAEVVQVAAMCRKAREK